MVPTDKGACPGDSLISLTIPFFHLCKVMLADQIVTGNFDLGDEVFFVTDFGVKQFDTKVGIEGEL